MMLARPASRPVTIDEIVARYDGRAPRYTSYPTAVQFTPEVDEATYRRWLSELPATEAVGLYIHVPFCKRLCWYCGCNTRAVGRHDPVVDYVDFLVHEIEMVAAAAPARLRVANLHLGGGSPNLLEPDDLARIFAALKSAFDLTDTFELAAELDPATLAQDWVRAAANHGLQRASIGVQILDPLVQAAVNREESFEEVAAAVAWLREVGVASINVDLMYGLPHQTTTNTLATVDAVMRLRPERIALFGYAHVPWMKPHQRLIEESALPGPAERLRQFEAAAEHLEARGYVRIGIDHFALPDDALSVALLNGRLRRNFQGYTSDPPAVLIGLGASAISSLPQGYVQNAAQELHWRSALKEGRLPVARGVAVTAEDRFRGEIIERLMCDLAVDLDDVCRRHGRDRRELRRALNSLAPYVADGLVEVCEGDVAIKGLGHIVVRSVCAAFDEHLAPEAGRHARAL